MKTSCPYVITKITPDPLVEIEDFTDEKFWPEWLATCPESQTIIKARDYNEAISRIKKHPSYARVIRGTKSASAICPACGSLNIDAAEGRGECHDCNQEFNLHVTFDFNRSDQDLHA